MDTFHLMLAWGGYAAAAALFWATAKYFLPLASPKISFGLASYTQKALEHEAERDEAAGIRVIYCMCFWGGSVVIALLSAILHRLVIT